jgi:hypothetical protein
MQMMPRDDITKFISINSILLTLAVCFVIAGAAGWLR